MLNGVNSSSLSALMAVADGRSATQTAGDSFSQQLLSVLEDSIQKLGLKAADLKVVVQDSMAPATDHNSTRRQFLVTLVDTEPSCPAAGESPLPAEIYEQHQGWNSQWYATDDMAQWLADHFGGEVGVNTWPDWSSSSNPIYPAPPPQNTIRIGDKEVNAGFLALYFEPGRFSAPDLEAAAALYRAGIVNDYVRQNWSGLMVDALPNA
jgi:hypothetical protein